MGQPSTNEAPKRKYPGGAEKTRRAKAKSLQLVGSDPKQRKLTFTVITAILTHMMCLNFT